jgi:DNA-binding SARP family transcriptional activator
MNAAALAAQRPVIHLELHAYPTIRVQGQRVDLPLKGGLALIARLAAESDRLSRAAAAALLWPDADAGLGRGRLRRLMHDVNRRLGVDLIAGDADTLWLDAARFELQCDRSEALRIARRALQHGELSPEEAAPLLGRDAHRLLDGFVLEADGFAEWLDSSRREQAALVARALERLVARWLADERSAAALAAAERLVRIDPLAEAGYAGLIVARARRGDAAGIAAAYFECAESLRHELGVRPSAAFERVHAEAMSQCARAADRSAFVELLRRPTPQAGAVAAFA